MHRETPFQVGAVSLISFGIQGYEEARMSPNSAAWPISPRLATGMAPDSYLGVQKRLAIAPVAPATTIGQAIAAAASSANRRVELLGRDRIGCSTKAYEASAGTRDRPAAIGPAWEAVGQRTTAKTMKGQCHR